MPALEPLPGFWHNGGRLRVKEYAVKPLFALFWQICRFRRGPEDVPFAPALMAILLLAVAGLGSLSIVILSGVEQPRPEQDVAVSTQLMVQWLALAAWLVVVYLLLQFKRMGSRFVQTATAALGTDIVMAVPQFACFAIFATQSPESALAALGQFALLFVYVWDMLIKGHIYSHALNISRLQGNLLSLALSFGLFAISAALVAPPQ